MFEQVVDVKSLDRIRTLKGPAVLLMAALFGSVSLLDKMELNVERVVVKPKVSLPVSVIIDRRLLP